MGVQSVVHRRPLDRRLVYLVREPWPSSTGTSLAEGLIDANRKLVVTSEMDDNGVIFGDGIETDTLRFGYGQRVQIYLARQTLNLLAA